MPRVLQKLTWTLVAHVCLCISAETPSEAMRHSAKCRTLSQTYPKQYIAYKTSTPPVIDGHLDEAAWNVSWTEPFEDIRGNDRAAPPRFETRVKMRWDDKFLYVAAHLQETQIWANITKGPDVIFHDNDFEIFVDPSGSNHHYKEYEINANCTDWSLCLNKPYADGGYENSTRVFGERGWRMQAKSAVSVDGKINDPSVPARSWTVETSLPLSDLVYNTSSASPPRVWGLWRINFSRVEWRVKVVDGKYQKAPGPEDNWVWSPMGAIQMHSPERWGYLQFADESVNGTSPVRDGSWNVRECAMDLYFGQKRHMQRYGFYASDPRWLLDLVDRPEALDGTCASIPSISSSDTGYRATLVSACGNYVASISDDRLLEVTPRIPVGPLPDAMVQKESVVA